MIAIIGDSDGTIPHDDTTINVQRVGELKPNVRKKITEVYLFQNKNHPHNADTITVAFGLGGYRSLMEKMVDKLDNNSYLYINIPKKEFTLIP